MSFGVKYIFTILSLIIWSGHIHAQEKCNLQISGKLLSMKDSLPVPHAEIFIENGHWKTETSEDGQFLIKNLCHGPLLMEVDIDEHIHLHFRVFLASDSVMYIYANIDAGKLSTVNIAGHFHKVSELDAAQIELHNGESLADQLKAIPGIQNLQTGSNTGKPMHQGLTGIRLPIIVNGMRQEGQQWGNEHGPEIDIGDYSKSELITGAMLLKYGHDALGGIIKLESGSDAHSGETDITSGLGYSSTNRQTSAFSRISQNSTKQPLKWYLNASGRTGGNYRTPDYFVQNTALREFGLTTGFESTGNGPVNKLDVSLYQFESGIFSGSRIGSVSDLLDAVNRPSPIYGEGEFSYKIQTPRQSATHASAQYKHIKPNNTLTISGQADNRKEFDYHKSSKFNFPQLNLTLLNLAINQDLTREISKSKALIYGWSTAATTNRYGGYYFIPDMIYQTGGIYAMIKTAGKRWNTVTALRGDAKYLLSNPKLNGAFTQTTRYFGNIAAAFTAERIIRKGSIKLNLTRSWRAPWVNELYSYGVHHSSAAFEQGNSQLKSEAAYQSECIWTRTYGRFQTHTSAYANYFSRFINLTPSNTPVLTVRGAFPAYEYRQFNAFYSGVSSKSSFHLSSGMTITLQGDFIYGRDLINNVFPAYIPPSGIEPGIAYNKGKLEISVSSSQTFRQIFYTEGSDYLAPPKQYNLLNASVLVKNTGRKQRLTFFIDGRNLLNVRYRNYLDRFRYYTNMPGRNVQLRVIFNFHHHKPGHESINIEPWKTSG